MKCIHLRVKFSRNKYFNFNRIHFLVSFSTKRLALLVNIFQLSNRKVESLKLVRLAYN